METEMKAADYQDLQVIVDASDVAIRVASQLRQIEAGHPLSDYEALERADVFLQNASGGSSFIAGQNVAHGQFGNSLQPLNWATDSFLINNNQAPSQTPDYAALARAFEQMRQTIAALVKKSRVEPERIAATRTFFDVLGQLLASRADQNMRREALQIDVMAGV